MTTALPPGSTLGVLGGGQLGRMLAQAAARLGFDTVILDPQPNSPAGRVAREQIVAAYDDADALDRLGALADAVTFEFENVPAASVERLTRAGARVGPGPRALAVAQDRLEEKTFLNGVGATTVAFAAVEDRVSLDEAIARLGLPAVLKTRREGYDGKGQAWIRDAADAETALGAMAGRAAILEARADFTRELSIICARSWSGEIAVYPLGQNVHANGVLATTVAPAELDSATETRAREMATAILDGLDYVGVMGVELFQLSDGTLLVNEIAPRVHNTGHWTQDGCLCDQFEQHVRAVMGWPLGPTEAQAKVEMTNLLGPAVQDWATLAADPGVRLHLYGKGEARPGRKMGHLNRIID